MRTSVLATVSEALGLPVERVPDLLSIPDAAQALGVKCDRLRLLIRRDPQIRALTVKVGPWRAVLPEVLPLLRSRVCPTTSAVDSTTSPDAPSSAS